jgi:ketohexokinase
MDLTAQDIDFTNCPKHFGHSTPNSYIILNSKTGSRTILHTNLGLPEVTFEDFKKINILNYSWIHFEGRPNLSCIHNMILSVSNVSDTDAVKKPTISLEMEKISRNFDEILPLVDVVFVSKEYSQSLGYTNMTDTVDRIHLLKNLKSDTIVICPWGDQGAAGKSGINGPVINVPACIPKNVMDTIGAGDTFNATIIAALTEGQNLKQALTSGCKVAGTKVGQFGYNGLNTVFRN